jgi:hypothetical protein
LDEAPRSEKLRAVVGLFELPRHGRDDTLARLFVDEAPWVRACALHYAAEHRAPNTAGAAVFALSDSNPVVRETALVTCQRLSPEEAVELAKAQLKDEVLFVRTRAALIASRRATA